ncbi:MAG: enoyl-CoA hydratase-related protein [Sphingobium sp.]|uniref:enoyl-CoA hydratase-related protein n=1 Tax=Sphingobium sp. TaxID=1912891 RepID=UPI0029B96453|nr:enoyl-CoA hydratase-related protein [Sphingobium sp.]MDX3908533.1 enoyl-CoA hydratase-related protein [Sphingobium sp.]
MTNYGTILASVTDGVGVLSLNRPERLNAVIPEMFYEIIDAVEAFPELGARAILLKAEGRGFCSGLDLQAEGGLPDDLGQLLEDHYNPCIERFMASRLPVVAQVHGACAGIGASLALTSDFVIAGRSSYFLQAFVNIGLVPDGGATWMLPRLIGRARATRMMMLGEKLPADTAEDWGLIYKAVDDEALAEEASALAARLAALPTVSLGLIRKGISATQESSFSQALALERAHQREAGRSADFKEGVQAFLAKRPAKFEGK